MQCTCLCNPEIRLLGVAVHVHLVLVLHPFQKGINVSLIRTLGLICFSVIVGCLTIDAFIHEPIPRINDEFSYLLMADTFSSGRLVNSTPANREFFDTFHVLVEPVYVSKYFPVQGLFLALGQSLIGHPAVGVWISSALACAAMFWMVGIWIGPR